MGLLKSLLASAAIFSLAVAQTPRIAFTSVPAVAVGGQTYNITWGGGDGTPVTLTLREGDPSYLATIGTIASLVTGDYYLWTVNSSLPTAQDYALQITQGQDGINYSGEFSIVGSGTASFSYSGLTTSTANGTIITTGVIASRTSASMGTGTAMSRNTTFSSQSLSATNRTSTITATSTSVRVTSTASGVQSTTTANSNIGASMGSSAALVMGLFGAILFLQ